MKSAKDVVGPWAEPVSSTGLIERCKAAWETPICHLSDEMLATFLRQKIALSEVVPEAKRRLQEKRLDGTELYEGELQEALDRRS